MLTGWNKALYIAMFSMTILVRGVSVVAGLCCLFLASGALYRSLWVEALLGLLISGMACVSLFAFRPIPKDFFSDWPVNSRA